MHKTEPATTGRRGRLGPFTGGQLTVLLITGMLVIGLPVGAYAAVTGSNVFITDHTSGAHASVAPNGDLQTFATPPGDGIYMSSGGTGTGQTCSFYVVPSGETLIVTGVQFVPQGATGGGGISGGKDITEYLNLDTKVGCGDVYGTIAGGAWANDDPEFVSLNPGISLKSGTRLDLMYQTPTVDDFANVWVYGYLQSTKACGTSCESSALDRPLLRLLGSR